MRKDILYRLILEEVKNAVKEAKQSDHYQDRKRERGDILEILIPQSFYKGYDKKEVDKKLKKAVEDRLLLSLQSLEQIERSVGDLYHVVFWVLFPQVKRGEKILPLNLKVEETSKDGKKKISIGSAYSVALIGNTLTTFVLHKNRKENIIASHIQNQIRNGSGFVQKNIETVKDHIKERTLPKAEFIIDIDELMKGKEVKKQKANIKKKDLPYKVRGDYRADGHAMFIVTRSGVWSEEGKELKPGKYLIIDTASGKRGQPDARGLMPWIKVKLPANQEYLKGGKLLNTVTLKNIYTDAYWRDKA